MWKWWGFFINVLSLLQCENVRNELKTGGKKYQGWA